MQHRQDDFGRGTTLLLVDIHRNSTAIVGDGDGLILVDRNRDIRAIAGQGLVDRVVDDLEDHVVQAGPIIGVTDVHSRPFTDRVEAL